MDTSWIPDIVKEHPWATGGIVFGVGIGGYLLLHYSGGSSESDSSGTTGSSLATQNAELQAALQAAQIQAESTTADNTTSAQSAIYSQQISATQESTDAATTAQLNEDLAYYQAQVATINAQSGAQVQVAQLQAQSSVQLQTAADQTSLDIAQSNNGTALAIAQTNGQVSLGEAQLQAQTSIAGINAGVTENGVNNQTAQYIANLQAGVDINSSNNATALGTVQSNNAANVAALQSNNALAAVVNTNATQWSENDEDLKTQYNELLQSNAASEQEQIQALNATQNINASNNATTLSVAQIQAGVANHQIDATESAADLADTLEAGVYNNYINTAGQVTEDETNVAAQAYDYNTGLENAIISGINSGVYNKGGEGGANQVAALAALLNQSGIGTAAENSNSASDVASASETNTFLQAISKLGSLGIVFG
jgi:hypothetical protein